MADMRVSKGIVLAAGEGDRMGEPTSRIPKVLLTVVGKPLVLYPIEALERAGIREIAIIIGHLGDKVEAALGRNPIYDVSLQYIFNPDYQGGNAISVEVAGDWAAGEPFVLCMGDHLIHREYVCRFLYKAPRRETLGVDFRPGDHHILGEATKVLVDGTGLIRDIGKELTAWDGVDTGVFLLTERFVNAVKELRSACGIDIEISEVIRFMSSRGQDFVTVDMTGPFWADIDTAEDVCLMDGAEKWLAERWL